LPYDEPTSHNNWRAPYRKTLDGFRSEDNVLSFLKKTCIQFLQTVYSERKPTNLRYDDDEDKTEIKIVDQYAFQLEADEVRPAIIGIRGPVSYQPIGMNVGMQEMTMGGGVTANTDMLHSSVGFSCLSRVGLEAEQIASDVFNSFKFFRGTLQKAGFFSIKTLNVSSEQMIRAQGDPELFMVSVTMSCQLQDKWIIEPKAAAELRKIVLVALTKDGDKLFNDRS